MSQSRSCTQKSKNLSLTKPKMLPMKPLYSLLLFLCLSFPMTAQDSIATAPLKPVATDGFYEIKVPVPLRACSLPTLQNLHIMDREGNQLPYFVKSNPGGTKWIQRELLITSRDIVPKKSSAVLIKNSNAQIDNLYLDIVNTNISKAFTVSGSDDGRKWFSLYENGVLSDISGSALPFSRKRIDFPLVSYGWLKVEFNDRKTHPLKVLKAGTFTSNPTIAQLDPLSGFTIKTEGFPGQKITRLHLSFKERQTADKISFTISSPKIYARTVSVYTLETQQMKNTSREVRNEIGSFTLDSDKEKIFNIDWVNQRDVFVDIKNGNHPPLKIDAVQLYQKPLLLVTELQAGETYTITTGSKNPETPEFDLTHLRDHVNELLPRAAVGAVTLTTSAEPAEAPTSIWSRPWFMWSCISMGALLISFFTYHLVKDMEEKQHNETDQA